MSTLDLCQRMGAPVAGQDREAACRAVTHGFDFGGNVVRPGTTDADSAFALVPRERVGVIAAVVPPASGTRCRPASRPDAKRAAGSEGSGCVV